MIDQTKFRLGRLVGLVSTLLAVTVWFTTAQDKPVRPGDQKYIDALVATQNLGKLYVEDGAADGSVLQGHGSNLPASVSDVIELKERAIPVLINCLSDTRLTSATFEGGFLRGKPIRTPVGYVCLDILMAVTKDNPRIFIRDCADDGLGACMQPGFYFRPDDYYPVGKDYLARPWVLTVQRNWQRLYNRGLIRFRYPSGGSRPLGQIGDRLPAR